MITINITTRNRSEYIIRQLKYYLNQKFKGEILIGDASDKTHAEKTERFIASAVNSLNIRYVKQHRYTVTQSTMELSNMITTPYSAAAADGAFLVPKTIEKCVTFLESNPDYVIAHGKAALFSLPTNEPYGLMNYVGQYSLPIHQEETATERLTSFLENYSVPLYCVMRSQIWRNIWNNMNTINHPSIAGEVLPASLSVTYGKIKEIDSLYLLRHMHNKRTSLPSIYEWITNPDWSEIFLQLRDTLVKRIIEQDNKSDSEVQETVDNAIEIYLVSGLVLHGTRKNQFLKEKLIAKKLIKMNTLDWLNMFVGRIPFSQQVILFSSRIRKYLNSEIKRLLIKNASNKIIKIPMLHNKLSLLGLLDVKNPYHDDFVPICDTVTASVAKKSNENI